MGVSADRLGEGCSEVIRTVNKFRVVAVPGDAVLKRPPLVIVGGATVASLRAERLKDTPDRSLKVGEAEGPMEPEVLMHSRAKMESSERKVVSVV